MVRRRSRMRGRSQALVLMLIVVFSMSRLKAQSTIQYVYDELGRLIAVIDSNGDTATYTYDAVGNVLSIARHATTQVSVIAFSPTAGPVGTTVTIDGTGFSATTGLNT